MKVQRRELTVREAMEEAEGALGADGQDAPEFMQSLMEALSDISRHPEQLVLPMELPDEAMAKVDLNAGRLAR